ncbi:MAG TPA: LytTR family DNA-binding domain-containing protein [Chitinophagaceae bacterium]|nr:LytTR family DNA-binding domain-containing protein [Chitinophagaceae bacterium]
MNIVIIEDEPKVALDLKQQLIDLQGDHHLITILGSLEETNEWFSKNSEPDLIIADIQLGDGITFDFFKNSKLNCPVIFCTAYDQYALQAFQANGIAYLLKPITKSELEKSIAKVLKLKGNLREDENIYLDLIAQLKIKEKKYRSGFLVSFRDQLIPVSVDSIAFFKTAQTTAEIFTNEANFFPLPKTLDQLEKEVDPDIFFRVNRQYLVSRKYIKSVEFYYNRKLLINLKTNYNDEIIISREKAGAFLKWMEEK